jgi:hypothetical protein
VSRRRRSVPALAALAFLAATPSITSQTRHDFWEVLSRTAPAWDENGDGRISRAEIDDAVADGSVRGDEAASLAVLKIALRKSSLKDCSSSPDRLRKELSPGLDCERAFSSYCSRIRNTSRVLFRGDPAAGTFNQGALSDCFLLAGTAAILQRDPGVLHRMIREAERGRYVVDFRGTGPVDVKAPTDAEIAYAAVDRQGGIWPVVLEKACAAAKARARGMRQDEKQDGMNPISGGGSAASAIRLLTGRVAAVINLREKEKAGALIPRLNRELERAMGEGRIALASSHPEVRIPGFTPKHTHAVIAFDPKRNVVRLWDPHGRDHVPDGRAGPAHGYAMNHGLFELPMERLFAHFRLVAIETDIPLAR